MTLADILMEEPIPRRFLNWIVGNDQIGDGGGMPTARFGGANKLQTTAPSTT